MADFIVDSGSRSSRLTLVLNPFACAKVMPMACASLPHPSSAELELLPRFWNPCRFRLAVLLLAGFAAWSITTFPGHSVQAQDAPADASKPEGPSDRPAAASSPTASPAAAIQFAWNRTDKYVAPDFEGYFAKDDAAAVRRLDEFLSRAPLREQFPAEFVDVVRRGLRSTPRHKASVLSMLGNSLIWNKKHQDAAAIELMYHATGSPDAEVVHYAMYFGPTVVADRSDNLIRMMMLNYDRFDREIQGRIVWGMKTYGDAGQTAKRLETLLDAAADLGENPTIATLETYRQFTGQEPPRAERFAGLGKWVVLLRHRDWKANDPSGENKLRIALRSELSFGDAKVLDYASRIDQQDWVGVILVQGVSQRDELMRQIQSHSGYSGESMAFNDRFLKTHRLSEWVRHDPARLSSLLPRYTHPPLDERLAWNDSREFISPNFERFFPEDPAAGMKLDAMAGKSSRAEFTDREVLDAFRQGLRGSRKTPGELFAWLAGALSWPAAPYQTEIFYQAADPAAPDAIREAALYYGLASGEKVSGNIPQLFRQILLADLPVNRHNSEGRDRILWAVRSDPAVKQLLADGLQASLAEQHATYSMLRLHMQDMAYQQLLEKPPAARELYGQRIQFVILFRIPAATTVAEVEAEVSRRFSKSKHWVDHAVETADKEIVCWAIVQGYEGVDWLKTEMKEKRDFSILFGDVVASPIWSRAEAKIPAKLKPYLK